MIYLSPFHHACIVIFCLTAMNKKTIIARVSSGLYNILCRKIACISECQASKTAPISSFFWWRSCQAACVQHSNLRKGNLNWKSIEIKLTGRFSGLEGSGTGSIMDLPSLNLWASVRKMPSTWSATESSLALVSNRGMPRSSAQRCAVLVVTTWSPWKRWDVLSEIYIYNVTWSHLLPTSTLGAESGTPWLATSSSQESSATRLATLVTSYTKTTALTLR